MRYFSRSTKRFLIFMSAAVLSVSIFLPVVPAHALQLTSRSLTLSSSAPAPATSSYTFGITVATATTIKSINIDICDSASNSCSPSGTGVPSGLVTTSATVGSVSAGLSGAGSWTGTFTTNGRLRLANNSNSGTPTSGTIVINNITNPTAANTTFYARITTYSDAAWTTALDTGTVTASTAAQITVSATVPEMLTFCTGTSGITSSSCAGATGTSVNLGVLDPGAAGTGTSQIGVTTNASTGYNITVNGTTLTSGANTIAALASQTASTTGTAQFGINLRANTTPTVGSDPAGAGTATPTANYNTANQYRFVTGDQIASKGSGDSFRLFTVSYIANISAVTLPGAYSTTITYICTATY